jgi:multicomponent Na+:H+ antiporter subunit D
MLTLQNTPWSVILIVLPLIGAMLSFLWPRNAKTLGLIISSCLLISVAGLAYQLITLGAQRYAIGGWKAPLGIDLYADGLSLLMLAITALIGLAISIYSSAYFNKKQSLSFWPLWMFLWAALNALFLSGDIFNLYVTLELLGLSAVALVALAGGANALSGAMRYLLVSLIGSLAFLLGVALLYHSFGTVDIALLSERMEPSPAVWAAMGLMIAGLLIKTALFPLHFWLPPAHSSAPAPVSALLSALVVKASFYILLRLWQEVFPQDSNALAQLLGIFGAAAILWGGVQALRQTRLKLQVAYSTVAQIGYLFLAFPLASIFGWKAALYMLISHAVAKTAMFMAAGNILLYAGHDRIKDFDCIAQRLPLTLFAFGLAGVSLMGLPPSGGFIGKWLLLEATLISGQWWWCIILIIGGLLTAANVFRVIGYSFTPSNVSHETQIVPKRMEWSAFLVALVAIILGFVAPWLLELMMIGSPFGESPL